MPKDLTSDQIQSKNEPYSATEILWLVELQMIGTDAAVFIAANNEDVIAGGKTYQAFPLQVDEITESSDGSIPGTRLVVSNVTREFLAILEHHRGFVDQLVVLKQAFANDLDNPVTVGEWTITEVDVDTDTVGFRIEPHPIFDEPGPKRRMHATCGWVYQDEATCGFPTQAKVDATPALSGLVVPPRCTRSLDGAEGCRAKRQAFIDAGLTGASWTLNGESVTGPQWPKRFGGFVGVPRRRS